MNDFISLQFISMGKWLLLLAFPFLPACQKAVREADAYGNFEAKEITVASEATGKIISLEVEEGQVVEAGQFVGLIDTSALSLRKLQIHASLKALQDKKQDVKPQIQVLNVQRQNLERERNRLLSLVEANLAPSQKLEEMEGQISLIDQQILSAQAQNQTINLGILAEIAPLSIQIKQIEDQIQKCFIVNPVKGTILLKTSEAQEFASPGKPLYTIADLREMSLRVFLSGDQLSDIQLGQKVQVRIDDDISGFKELPGMVSWISAKAEFTPRIIQTKAQRVNLVYAVKIKVVNDGSIKIGMPGELIIPQ